MLVARVGFTGLKVGVDGFAVFILGIVCKVETFDSGSTLIADIADDVGDGISLVSEMTISNISHAKAIATGVAGQWGEEAGFHFWSDFLVIDLSAVVGACA